MNSISECITGLPLGTHAASEHSAEPLRGERSGRQGAGEEDAGKLELHG